MRWASALRTGFKMTKPESENTGMHTTQPISWMARTGCFLPITRTMASASWKAAPVFSRMKPMSVPKMTTSPKDLNVAAKPSPMTSVISASGIPPMRPKTRETNSRERNG